MLLQVHYYSNYDKASYIVSSKPYFIHLLQAYTNSPSYLSKPEAPFKLYLLREFNQ